MCLLTLKLLFQVSVKPSPVDGTIPQKDFVHSNTESGIDLIPVTCLNLRATTANIPKCHAFFNAPQMKHSIYLKAVL